MQNKILFTRKAAYALTTGPIIGGYGALLLAGVISKLFSPFCPGGKYREVMLERSYERYPEWTAAVCGAGEDVFFMLGRIFVCIGIPLGIWCAWSSWWDEYERNNKRLQTGQTRNQKIMGLVGEVIQAPLILAGWLLLMAPMVLIMFVF